MGTGKRVRSASVTPVSPPESSDLHGKKQKLSPLSRKNSATEDWNPAPSGSSAKQLLEDLLGTVPELKSRGTGSEEHQVRGNAEVQDVYTDVTKAVEAAFLSATSKIARPHQSDAVAKLISLMLLDQKARQLRPYNYLVQHATGTGKSLTISALALVLLRLRKDCTLSKAEKISSPTLFSAVIVLTDRLQLDRQLGDTLESFLAPNDWTLWRCANGSDLANALRSSGRNGPLAILTTLQKFGSIARFSQGGTGNRDSASFRTLLERGRVAIIADEAHRSHGKSSSMTINEILGGEDGQPAGVTYFGFSATPSRAALQLFGVRRHGPTGTEYAPAHCYSMQQAIADGHVMNPLMDYTCVRPDLEVDAEGGKRVALSLSRLRKLASGNRVKMSALGSRLQSSERVLRFKAKFILQHFSEMASSAQPEVEGREEGTAREHGGGFCARAMVVCRSRADVMNYTRELRRCAAKRGSAISVFGAFSGELGVRQSAGAQEEQEEEEAALRGRAELEEVVTEASLNAGSATLEAAELLVVCNKLETGFDEPRLAAMYIDRPLSGARCVQVLSRCNRRCPGKAKVAVVDFANAAEEVRGAFAEFWRESCWGCSAAAVEARAMEELDACVARILALLQAAAAERGAVDVGGMTSDQLAERLGQSWEAVERALQDLELYQGLCQRLSAHKFELPPSFAAALQRRLAEAREQSELLSAHSSDAAPAASDAVLRRVAVGGVTETHSGAITVRGRGAGSAGAGGIVRWDAGSGGTEGGKAVTLRQLAQQSALQRGADVKATCAHVTRLRDAITAAAPGSAGEVGAVGDAVATGAESGGGGRAAAAAVEVGAALMALQRLDLVPMSREILVETGIGVVVKALRKHADSAVKEMAKGLVARWKGLLRDTYPLTLPAEVLSHRHGGHLADNEGRELVVVKLRDALMAEAEGGGATASGGGKASSSNDEDASAGHAATSEAQHAAAQAAGAAGGGSAAAVARRVEQAVATASVRLGRMGGSSQDKAAGVASGVGWYKQKVRQLLFNLRDPANQALRRRVRTEALSAEELVAAEALELANEALAAEKKKVREEEARRAALELQNSGVLPNTSEYQCPSCGGQRCHVTFGMKGGWISSEKEGSKEVVCCDCLASFDG